jgi:hypothetical protein
MFMATMSHLSLRSPDVLALEHYYVDTMSFVRKGCCDRVGAAI